MNKKQLMYTASFAMLMFLSILVIVHSYKGHSINPFLNMKEKDGTKQIGGGVDKMKAVFNLGMNGSLGLGVSIPYSRKEQFQELWVKYPKIKNDFLLKVEPGELKSWVEQRNFAAIKGKILDIVNSNLKYPVKTLYIDSFFYE